MLQLRIILPSQLQACLTLVLSPSQQPLHQVLATSQPLLHQEKHFTMTQIIYAGAILTKRAQAS